MSKILYFKANLIAESPLIIGGGIADNTDSDILIGGDGKPYIPGTTLAGICRHYLRKNLGEKKVNSIFGYTVDRKSESQKSNIIFYDATLNTCHTISTRDGVKLGSYKNAESGGKFNYEIIEAGSVFSFRIELQCEDYAGGKEIIDYIVNGFNSHELRIGAKTTRGFGKIKTSHEKKKTIDLNDKTGIQEYIDFSWDNVKDTYELAEDKESQYITWNVEFELSSFLFIRNYATTSRVYDPKEEKEAGKIVDAEQLLNIEKKPVIPGTSWAGVFRHHFVRVLNKVNYGEDKTKKLTDSVFGYVIEDKKEDNANPSKIIFSESVIEDSYQLNRTRNAIDRFTGGAGDKKLFTTRPTYKGNGKLEIRLPKSNKNFSEEEFKLTESIIAVCIEDLKAGFLTVGGETSTGGGLIKVRRA